MSDIWEVVDEAVKQGFDSLDPEDEEYLHKLNALTNAVGKINEAKKNDYDEKRLEQTGELAKKRNRIEIFKVIASVFAGLCAAGVGVWEFIKTMNFETDGGFFRSSAGKQVAREKRKEKDKDTYYR
jgi:hypothetical protein